MSHNFFPVTGICMGISQQHSLMIYLIFGKYVSSPVVRKISAQALKVTMVKMSTNGQNQPGVFENVRLSNGHARAIMGEYVSKLFSINYFHT